MTFLQPLRRLSDMVNQLAIVTCVACVLAMLGISFSAFIYKLATGASLSWTYSLARLFLPWIGFLSMTISLRYGEHVAMTLLARSLPRWVTVLTAALSLLALGLFGVLLLWYGWDYFQGTRQVYLVSDAISVHGKFTAIVVPLSGAIILLHLVQGFDLLEHFIDDETAIDELIEMADVEEQS